MTTLDALFTPADFEALARTDLRGKTCVVFDVLRATSSMVTALSHGAPEIVPAGTIPEALSLRDRDPACLLAGERHGVRIRANLTGSLDFELGNSPREFTAERVAGRRIGMTTTNGTRALRACARARTTLIGSFLNLRATADFLLAQAAEDIVLVGSGTGEQAAYEDVLGVGALTYLLEAGQGGGRVSDAAFLARRLFLLEQNDLAAAFTQASNGRRLLTHPELRDDVAFCAQVDRFPLVACLGSDGAVRVVRPPD